MKARMPIGKSHYVFRKSITKSILINLGFTLCFLLFYLYVSRVGEAYYFLYLFVFPFLYFIVDMRKKIIIQRGYIRYVHVFGSKKVILKDVASIELI